MQQPSYYYSNYRCVACNLIFRNFDEQKQHYFSYHSHREPYTPRFNPVYRQLPALNKPNQLVKCNVCNISCSSQTVYDFHIKGKKHSKALNKIALATSEALNNGVTDNKTTPGSAPIIQSQISYTPNLRCDICQVTCLQPDQLQKHLKGSKHQKKIKFNLFAELKAKKDPSVYCNVCDLYMMEESMIKHRESGKHKRKRTDNSNDGPTPKKAKSDIETSITNCGFCHIALKSPDDAILHYQSPKHALNMTNRSNNFDLWCDLCQISFHNQNFLDMHLKGFKHYVRANRGNNDPQGEFSEKLLKMREKMKNLKANIRDKKLLSSEKDNVQPNEIQNDTEPSKELDANETKIEALDSPTQTESQ